MRQGPVPGPVAAVGTQYWVRHFSPLESPGRVVGNSQHKPRNDLCLLLSLQRPEAGKRNGAQGMLQLALSGGDEKLQRGAFKPFKQNVSFTTVLCNLSHLADPCLPPLIICSLCSVSCFPKGSWLLDLLTSGKLLPSLRWICRAHNQSAQSLAAAGEQAILEVAPGAAGKPLASGSPRAVALTPLALLMNVAFPTLGVPRAQNVSPVLGR